MGAQDASMAPRLRPKAKAPLGASPGRAPTYSTKAKAGARAAAAYAFSRTFGQADSYSNAVANSPMGLGTIGGGDGSAVTGAPATSLGSIGAPATTSVPSGVSFSPGAASGADGTMGDGWSSGAASGDDGDPTASGLYGAGTAPGAYQAAVDSLNAGAPTSDAVSLPNADAPSLTINKPADAAPSPDGITPAYAPGEKTALKTGLNMAAGMVPGLGLANLVSGLFGGPTVGGYITDHSSPGEPAQPSGNGNSHNNPVPGSTQYWTPNGQGPGPSGSSASPSGGSDISTAQKAYLAAIKNLPGPGAAARKANAVPLRARGTSTVKYYNPLEDPTVLNALAAAHA